MAGERTSRERNGQQLCLSSRSPEKWASAGGNSCESVRWSLYSTHPLTFSLVRSQPIPLPSVEQASKPTTAAGEPNSADFGHGGLNGALPPSSHADSNVNALDLGMSWVKATLCQAVRTLCEPLMKIKRALFILYFLVYSFIFLGSTRLEKLA